MTKRLRQVKLSRRLSTDKFSLNQHFIADLKDIEDCVPALRALLMNCPVNPSPVKPTVGLVKLGNRLLPRLVWVNVDCADALNGQCQTPFPIFGWLRTSNPTGSTTERL